MNPPKCDDLDYIHFLAAAQNVFTCTEAARSQPGAGTEAAPAHDAFTRLLGRQPPDTEALWQEAEPCVQRDQGVLVLDDSTLDKPYAKEMDLVTYPWSGKHGEVVKGINLLTLLWSDGQAPSKEAAHIPCDFRLYDKPLREAEGKEGKTKNDHFREMLSVAAERGFVPGCVLFDSWYSGLDNLKAIRGHGWTFLTRLKRNRQVNPDDTYNRAVEKVAIDEEGRVVHLKGFVKVFRTSHADAAFWVVPVPRSAELTIAPCSGPAENQMAY